jgi:hypothetical protein
MRTMRDVYKISVGNPEVNRRLRRYRRKRGDKENIILSKYGARI